MQQLVLRLDLGQGGVQIPLGNVHCRLGKELQRLHHPIDGNGTEDKQQSQSDDKYHRTVFHDLMGEG